MDLPRAAPPHVHRPPAVADHHPAADHLQVQAAPGQAGPARRGLGRRGEEAGQGGADGHHRPAERLPGTKNKMIMKFVQNWLENVDVLLSLWGKNTIFKTRNVDFWL